MERRSFIKNLLAGFGGAAVASVISPDLKIEELVLKESDEELIEKIALQGDSRFYSLPKEQLNYNPATVAEKRFPDIASLLGDRARMLSKYGIDLDEPPTKRRSRIDGFFLNDLSQRTKPITIMRHSDANLFTAYWSGRVIGEITDKDVIQNAGAWDAWIESMSRGCLLGEAKTPEILAPSLFGRNLMVNMRAIRAAREKGDAKDWMDEYNLGVVKGGNLYNV